MSELDIVMIDARTAEEVCGRTPLSDEARALLTGDMTPRAFLDMLMEKQLGLDGIHFLAHAMVKRGAVWWACQCAADALGPEPSEVVARALESARAWVSNPSDENRRACWPAAEAAGIATPAGCAAMAAYLSGGSLAPPELPAVPPGEDLTARLVVSALMLAAVLRQPELANQRHRAFLRNGCAIADGNDLWSAPTRSAPPPSPRSHTPARPVPKAYRRP